MAKRRTRRQQAILKRRIFLSICAVLLVILIGMIALAVHTLQKGDKPSGGKPASSATESTASKPIPETTATVVNTGDIMVHSTQLDGARVAGTGDYDFSAFFKAAAPYFQAADLAVANLEVTFGGTESGKFSGYPAFNTPDSLADVIKNAGLTFLVTSNNHCYDTGLFGLKRTAQVLKSKGIEFVGTKETPEDPTFIVKELNNIKIGIANYTYETDGQMAGRKYLNGAIIAQEANALVNSFSYQHIEDFYSEADSVIASMKQEGAEYIVFYMHWGNEYQTSPSTWQKTIAQQLSNRGVNMIIGGHPHVIQPIERIHPEGGEGSTVCVYSLGNCISNQRQELMDSCRSGHTEDAMLFSFTLTKNQNGVALTGLDLIPSWVDKYRGGSGYQYTLYPLESPDAAAEKYGLTGTALTKAKKSYDRTKAIVAAGLTECQQAIGCQVTFQQ